MHTIKYYALLFISLIFLTACQPKETPEKGKQYTQLQNPIQASSLEPVTYIFALTCHTCRDMQMGLSQIEKEINQSIGLLPLTTNVQNQTAALFYFSAAMQTKKQLDNEVLQDLYNVLLQNEGQTLTQQQRSIEKVFIQHNLVSPYQFDNMQQQLLSRELNQTIQLNHQLKLIEAPAFLVKGKYLVNVSAHENLDDIANTINFLITQK